MAWTTAPSEGDWQAVVDMLVGGGPVLLLAHVAPDADAVGSALAAGIALHRRAIEVQVSFGDEPFEIPRVLRGLPGQELLVAPDELTTPNTVVTFDVSSIDRLGVLQAVAEGAPNFAAIDHHASYTGFAPVSVVDVASPATAAMTLELVDRLGVELDADIATCIYAGLITDTGSFRYFGTTPATHHIAARLLATGIRHDIISRQIYDDEPFAAVKLLGIALSRAELNTDAVGGLGMVSTFVTSHDRRELGLPIDAVERVIDELRVATEAEVSCVMKEEDLGAWRVSLRSKGRVDVSKATVQLGGGGHRFAAGYTTSGDRAAILAELTTVLNALPHMAE